MEKRKKHQSFRLAQQWRLLLLLFLLLHSAASAAQGHNYAGALHKSLLYFKAQRSGRLLYNQRVGWRDHSGLTEGLEQGVDLVGGYYDAGDHDKFGLPMAFTVTMLSWGVIEYRDEIDAAGELEHALEAIKWGTNYFIKAHTSPNVLWAEVGDGGTDHYCWQRSEDMTTSRQAYKVDENNPGSDLAGETAAVMAAASIVFRKTNPHYSQLLLHHAQQQEDESIAEPCLFLTLVFLLRAPLQRMESGILSQKWNGKTAGYVLLYCVPVFALQLIIILIGPNFNKGFLPLRVLLLGLLVMYEPEQVVFEALAFLAFLSLLCCAGVSIWMLVYDSLALRSLLDLEARRRISDDHNETISLIANQSLLGESMGVSPERNSDVSTKHGSISFRTKKDGTSVDTYVELSLFSPSQHVTPPGSPRPLGWPMIPPHQLHAP